MRTKFAALAVLIGGALCAFVATQPAEAKATVLKDLPIGGALPANACTGEVVLLAGTATVVVRNNGLHLTVKDFTATGVVTNTVWTGVGASTQNASFKTTGNGASTSTTTFKIRLANGGDTFHSKLTMHTTVNANGVATATTTLENITCN